MPLTVIRNDITTMKVDAIVNATNTKLIIGDGVSGVIFNKAGTEELQAICNQLAPIQTGEAVITPGFALPAKHIIHAVGPVYHDGKQGEAALLRSCYRNALNLAQTNGCESIAFPVISSGNYGYPKDEALTVATSAIGEWLLKDDTNKNGMDVSLVVFDNSTFALSKKLLGEVETFIDENYESFRKSARFPVAGKVHNTVPVVVSSHLQFTPNQVLYDVIKQLDEPFAATLQNLIKAKRKTAPEIYKRANFDRRLFHRIIKDKKYKPKKEIIAAFAVALELTLDETSSLLESAGFMLSRSIRFDMIIKFFITKGEYNIFKINNVLYDCGEPTLGERDEKKVKEKE